MSVATPSPFAISVKAKDDFEVIPPEDYVGALVAIVDLGTHHGEYKGKPKRNRQILLVWELNVAKKDGENHLVAAQYTLASSENAGLRLLMEKVSRRKFEVGEQLDPFSLLGQSFGVSIVNEKSGENVYHRIAKDGIGPLHRRDEPIPPGDQRNHYTYWIPNDGPPPSLDWLPYLYGRPVADVIRESEELGGPKTPAKPATKASDPNAIATVEAILRSVASQPKGSPSKDAAINEAERIMKEEGILQQHLADDTAEVLLPF